MRLNDRMASGVILLLLLSGVVMFRQLVTRGYFSSTENDTLAYVSWASQFAQALHEGIVYPRWTALNFWGYGSPTFVLYSPLAFYLVAAINVFTDSITAAMNVAKFLSLAGTSIGFFFLVRQFYSDRVAVMTAAFSVVFPYTLWTYYSGTFAPVMAPVWFSPILFFVQRYVRYGEGRDVIYAGACIGGLIMTHLVTAYMFMFVVAAFVIASCVWRRRWRYILLLPAAGAVGMLVSAAYLLPLLFEGQFMNLGAFVGEGFDYSLFFVLPDLRERLPSDHFWVIHYDIVVLYLIIFTVLIILFSYKGKKTGRGEYREDALFVNRFFVIVTLGGIGFLFGISRILWETIPFFTYIQFPARWLTISAFSVSFLSSCLFHRLESSVRQGSGRSLNAMIVILFVTCLLMDGYYIAASSYLREDSLLPARTVTWTLEHLPRGVSFEKILSEGAIGPTVTTRSGGGRIGVVKWASAERELDLVAPSPETLRVRTFYFPGWRAYIDGMESEIERESESGAVLVDCPAGSHRIVLKFQDTPVRTYSKYVTIFSLAAFAAFVFLAPAGRRERCE